MIKYDDKIETIVLYLVFIRTLNRDQNWINPKENIVE